MLFIEYYNNYLTVRDTYTNKYMKCMHALYNI